MAQPQLGSAHIADIAKKNKETIDAEGWLHSGDKGMITEQGMVKITGRYKELIIGDGGENIAPVPIEDHVKKTCDAIAECMMVGDQRKYNVALITLKAVGANGEVPGTDDLDAAAKRVNPAVTKISQAMRDPKYIATVAEAITRTNDNGKLVPNNAFKIQKLKRATVEGQYKQMIDHMYATEGVYIEFQEFE